MTDPLRKSVNPAERELFARVSQLLGGASHDVVNNVALNLVINSIRQTAASRRDAEAKINELFSRTKTILLEAHYDAVTGKRRPIFPFTQTLEMPFHVEKDKIFKQ